MLVDSPPCRGSRPGFTLVELLVVITIITILLSLLVPAMEKAIYQAELAVCGANLHGIGAAVLSYASGNSRFFPGVGRELVGVNAQVFNTSTSGAFDLRQILRDYISVSKAFVDPLAGKIDLDVNTRGTARTGSGVFVFLYANYNWYFNWGYINQNERWMRRVGQRFSWRGDWFNVLAADADIRHESENWSVASHPDMAGLMTFQRYQDEDPGWLAPRTFHITASWWVWARQRGDLDNNYLFDDGSVHRLDRVEVDDSRLEDIPDHQNASQADVRKVQIPAAR